MTSNNSPVCSLPNCAIQAFNIATNFPLLEVDCSPNDFSAFCKSSSTIQQYLGNLTALCDPNGVGALAMPACSNDADCCSGFQAGLALVTNGCGVNPGNVAAPSFCSTTTTTSTTRSYTTTTTSTTSTSSTSSTTSATSTSTSTSTTPTSTTTTTTESTTSDQFTSPTPRTPKTTASATSTTLTSTISIPISVINPSPTDLISTPTVTGSVFPQQEGFLSFPTTPYTGGALLTGTCAIPEYTLVALPDGSLMEVPIIGCADNRPDCCPSLNPVTAPPSTATVVVTVYESTEVVMALSADPLTICPSDYADLGSVCCPYGFTLYSLQVLGQTPCYTVLSTNLPVPPGISADLSSIASMMAKTATSTAPTYSVQVVVNEVFALNLPHKPQSHNLSVGTQAAIGVGAGAGGLIFLLLLLWSLCLRRRLRRESQKVQSMTSSGMVMSPSQPTPNSPQSASIPGSPVYQMPYGGYYAGVDQRHGPSPPLVMGPYGVIPPHPHPPPPPPPQPQFYSGVMGELGTTQVDPVEAESRQPRPGVSRMPDGRMYEYPAEMGARTPPIHGLVQPQPLRTW